MTKEARDFFNIWWRLLRPHTLSAAFIPVFIGTALALEITSIHWGLLGAMLLASLLIQAATNMFNEYYDFKRGLDTKHSIGIGGTIVRDNIHPKVVLGLAFVFLAIATVLGIYICVLSSWWLAVVGFIGMSVGYLYTGGPYPIAYTPFGELLSGLFMGLLIIVISFFIQTGFISLKVVLISIPTSILIGAILMSNNLRDFDGDKAKGRRTLAIILGKENALSFLASMFFISFMFLFLLIYIKLASIWSLLVLLSIPTAIQAVKGFIGKEKPIEMMPAMKLTAKVNIRFGFLLGLSIIINYFLAYISSTCF